ncbi:nucleolar pre-ribosomal-associated protein 1-like isoform X2 [Catharus ustulatus]|uniref:nucleolar pre-ribosomal-associated protein 1-like isoform X2 n=1 Tax=Catharus ustulatus TaxID=91951 RepID=UPI00140A09C5|nr:nucleolar pre-ribosomal-associated protein 1-like isoform X2 [Catharus ustulatus]
MLKPGEHMYTQVNRFLLSHQFLDLRKIPDFFQFFYSFDFECRILAILQSAARVIRAAAHELIQDHSLLTWLLHSLEKRFLEDKVINKIISLLHTLWLTNLGDKRENKNQLQEKRKLLPIQLVNEFLTNVDVARLTEFLSTLRSVLESRAIVGEAFREMRRFMANDSILSSRELLLLLLHEWSLVSKDLQLQEELQALAQRCQNTELLTVLVFLTSIYKGNTWLGAQELDLLLSHWSALVQVMNYRIAWELGNKEKKLLRLFAKRFGYIRALIQGTNTSSSTFCALPSSL